MISIAQLDGKSRARWLGCSSSHAEPAAHKGTLNSPVNAHRWRSREPAMWFAGARSVTRGAGVPLPRTRPCRSASVERGRAARRHRNPWRGRQTGLQYPDDRMWRVGAVRAVWG